MTITPDIIPEAQLQAYVLGLVREALPHEKPESFKIEKRFKLKLGHSEQDHDGTALWEAEGRADLLVFHDGRPLAVFELKREDKALLQKDLKQGQSYAAMLFPRPPLVIVSNGKHSWVRQVDDGTPLDTDAEGVGFVEKLFANIAKLAAANNSWAIEVLMGPETTVWVEAVRRRTDEMIARMTGDATDTRKAFGEGILFQRKATAGILSLFGAGAKAIVVEGAPLAGKSNVLREFALATRASSDWATLMINGATSGAGLFQRIANILGAALEWKLTDHDVRTWLRRMSHSSRRPALVLAVDGLRPGSPVANDLEELADEGFGDGLRLLVSTDRADDILRDHTGRGDTALANLAEVVKLGLLDDDEFAVVRRNLAVRRIFFYDGAELSDEYRTPWVLRLVLASGSPPTHDNHAAFIPASMGPRIVKSARARFGVFDDVARFHRLVARDALADEEPPSPELALDQANAFVIRRDALTPAGEQAATSLEAQGWVSFSRHPSGEDVIAFRVPEFFMSELAFELAALLDVEMGDDPDSLDDVALLLKWQAHRFFLGDIVGAQAILDLAARRKSLPLGLLEPLMDDEPEAESIAGKFVGFPIGDGVIVNLRFDEQGRAAIADEEGNAIGPYEPVGLDGDSGEMYGNTTAWMILSQLAWAPSTLGDTIEDRVDISIILWVGRCNFALMRASDFTRLRPQHTYDVGPGISVLAAEHALAEPLTSAIHKLFAEEWHDLDFFFDRLVEIQSLPLTARVHHVLAALDSSVVPGLDAWARDKLDSIVHPLLRGLMAPAAA